MGWKSGNITLCPPPFVAKTPTECTHHFSSFFVRRMRRQGGVFSNFNEKSQILRSKFGLYDFFLLSPRSKLLDLWFIYWVLLVEKSTSFFCFFYAEWHFVLPTLFLRFPAPVLFQKNRSGISKRLDLFLTRRREIWKRSNVFLTRRRSFFSRFLGLRFRPLVLCENLIPRARTCIIYNVKCDLRPTKIPLLSCERRGRVVYVRLCD